MNSGWFSATNFERMYETVSAINTLSIHAKLTLAGVADPSPVAEIQGAREHLLRFLRRLDRALEDAREGAGASAVGTDPELGDLALQLLHAEPAGPGRRLRADSLESMPTIINSDRPEDLQRLIPELEVLREVFEERAQGDVMSILGDRE